MFDYKLIEALAMIAREGGFDKAAKALCITQSAVSQRLKLLEELTGQVLIARSTPPRATEAGRKLLKHYLKVKQLEDDLLEEVSGIDNKGFTSMAVGINADSLALWLLDAIQSFLVEEKVLLDIRVNDQEQTHQLLKDGEVMGCISSQEQPMQGCRVEYLGRINYHMMAAQEFATLWFPNGLSIENIHSVPAVMFNREDELHYKFFQNLYGEEPSSIPTHYVPSIEKFAEFITVGLAYGMMPDRQCIPLIRAGKMIDLAPDNPLPVKLYWHCWSLNSKFLNRFTQQLTIKAKTLLDA